LKQLNVVECRWNDEKVRQIDTWCDGTKCDVRTTVGCIRNNVLTCLRSNWKRGLSYIHTANVQAGWRDKCVEEGLYNKATLFENRSREECSEHATKMLYDVLKEGKVA